MSSASDQIYDHQTIIKTINITKLIPYDFDQAPPPLTKFSGQMTKTVGKLMGITPLNNN